MTAHLRVNCGGRTGPAAPCHRAREAPKWQPAGTATIPVMNSPAAFASASPTPTTRPRVYLAGPDVFFADRARIFEDLVATCDALGLQALPPWENSDGAAATLARGEPLARHIYEDNIRRIREADGVIAHLVNFRGQEPDSGTVFEMGFAVALGKPVVGYGIAAGSYAQRVAAAIGCERDEQGRLIEAATRAKVEDLGQPVNLMLGCSAAALVGTAREALEVMARLLARER